MSLTGAEDLGMFLWDALKGSVVPEGVRLLKASCSESQATPAARTG